MALLICGWFFAKCPLLYPDTLRLFADRKFLAFQYFLTYLFLLFLNLFTVIFPNGIEYSLIILLVIMVIAKTICLCVHIYQNGHQESPKNDWKTFCAVISVTVIFVTILGDGYDILYMFVISVTNNVISITGCHIRM